MHTILPYTLQNSFAAARDDAEVDSLLNTDVYKFLMLDFILAHPEYSDMKVRWKMKVRAQDVKLANVIPEEAIREQLDCTRAIKGVSQADISYMRGMQVGTRPLLREETLAYLQDFRLPEYHLQNDGQGGYDLTFEGSWAESTLWEIYALKIMNSQYLYHYAKKAKITPVEWNGIMTRKTAQLYDDLEIVKSSWAGVNDFSTRRTMSTDIHRHDLLIAKEMLGSQFLNTSNVMLAREMWSNNPWGTNAHELRMITTAFEDEPEKIIAKMYEVDRQWMQHFPELAILLPDTYGTTFYLKHAPQDIIEGHTGIRFDSKDPLIAIPEYVEWLLAKEQDPQKKLAISSDGLTSRKIWEIAEECRWQVWRLGFGWGTTLTNNTKWLFPKEKENIGPWWAFSIVVKPSEVWRPELGKWVSTVKLTDNPNKGMGGDERQDLFKATFGVEGMRNQEVVV